jgi:hypothetical protein
LARSVKVHDDTHAVLKELKAQRRCGSIDEVIRDLVRESTGTPVGKRRRREPEELTAYLQG